MLTNPRRIAVVVLATFTGLALQQYAGIAHGLAYGFMLGFVVSLFIPARSCPIPR